MQNKLLADCFGPECPIDRSGSGNGVITNPTLGNTIQNVVANGNPTTFLSKIISNLVTLGFIVGSLIFFAVLMTGAIQWISSGGDKQALETAKGKITHALIGLVILFAAFAIIKLIEHFFGISILSLDMGKLIIQ